MILQPKRALVVAPSLRGADGVSVVGRQIVQALASWNIAVDAWVLDDPTRRDLIENDASEPDFIAQGSRVGIVMQGWKSSLAREECDLVIVTHLHLTPAVASHMLRRVPVAVYLHGVECWQPLVGWRRRLLARADRLLTNSRYTAEHFFAANPRFRSRDVKVCAPAVPSDLTPSLVPDDPVVLVVGRMCAAERYKGHDLLLDIWPSVRAKLPTARLVFAGDGDDRARLESRIHAEGLVDAVFVTGLLSRAELREHYSACRVFAMPSGSEGFGIVFLEAMAAGRPCIAAHGAADEVLSDDTGVLVPAGDREALITAVIRLLADDDLCRRMGAAAVKRAAAVFSMSRFSADLRSALGMVGDAAVPAKC